MQFGGWGQFGGGGQMGGSTARSEAYYRVLTALLPPGAFGEDDSNLMRLIARACASSVGDHGQVLLDRLQVELFPQLAEELLPEWEAMLEIVPPDAATFDERRAALLTKWRGGMSLSVPDLKKVLAPILGQDEADVDIREADPTVTSGTCGVFTAFVFRDPTEPGSYNISEAQRACDRAKSAHVRIIVGESEDFLTNDPYSLTNRDLLGA